MDPVNSSVPSGELEQRHLQLGWLALLIFVMLGVVLESLHGFKVGAYVNPSNATRRLVWTLAHAHGTLLGLVHIAFAFTVRRWAAAAAPSRIILASHGLSAATLLLPGGFFLGGFGVRGADPGLGIWLVPAGALSLLFSVWLTWRALCAVRPG